MRAGLLVLALAFVLASCARIPSPQEANDAVLRLQNYESRAWALGIVLIWADVALPIPQSGVIAALGIIYGTLLGGLLGSLGLITGGLLGYLLMLTSARRFVRRFVGLSLWTRWRFCLSGAVRGQSSSRAVFPTADEDVA